MIVETKKKGNANGTTGGHDDDDKGQADASTVHD